MQAKVLSVINIKGGVGKTTTIGCFAEILAELNKRVLIVDMDPQANVSQLFQRYQTHFVHINDILLLKGDEVKKENIQKAIQKTDYENIEIIASNEELSFVCNNITYDQSRSQQMILKKALGTIKEDYDFILIDNTPFFNILNINSLCASDYVITPVASSGFSYTGLAKLLNEIYNIKAEFNDNLEFLGVYMANVNKQKVIFKNIYESYKNELGNKFITTYIRQDKNIDESNTAFIPLMHYNKNCNAVKDYRNLLAQLNILDNESKEKLMKTINE